MREKLLIGFILIIAILTRILFLGQFPNGFTGDEAQQGYSAYSILKTGKDEWGQVLPLTPRGFGDYKPPLYTYLTIPSIAIFGLTIEAVRLPAALAGILVVIVTFYLTKKLLNDERIGLLAAAFMAISPWHIQVSRTAWEGGIGILTFSLGLLFYLKSGAKNFIMAAIFWGLTFYTYHSFRLFLLLFIIGLLIFSWKKLIQKSNLAAAVLLLIFILPILFNLNSTLTRSSDVGIFSSQQITSYFADKGTSPLPPILDKVLDNKVWFVLNQFSSNFLSYFSPTFYFSGSRSDSTYLNFPFFPLLYLIEALFWVVCIYILVTKKMENKKILTLWFLLSIIPASLAVGSMNANRAITLLPLTSIISALGFKLLMDKIPKLKIYLIAILVFSLLIFLNFYFIKLPQKPPDNLRYGYDFVFKKLLEVQDQYDEIVISKVFTEPQIFVAFYGKMEPGEFQKASQDWLRYEKANKLYVDQLESWNLGKFYFEDISWLQKDSNRKNALIVSKEEDFPKEANSILDIKNSKGKILYRLISTK